MTDTSTWCPLPWMSLNVRNTGDVRVCCQANTSVNQGLVKDANGVNYNLSKDGIHDFRNSDLMKQVRVAMMEGRWHESCIRCKRETESGMHSRRESEVSIWEDHLTENLARQRTAPDGTINVDENPLLYADLRFGNLCNLKCRMCGPTDSNQWYDDHARIWNVTGYSDGDQKVGLVLDSKGRFEPSIDIYSWYENPRFWLDLEKEIPSLRRLYIVGGEPLLIDQHYEFLQKCIDQGHAGDIIVEYNTNATNIPQRAWDIWKHFNRIQIGVSIDGVGEINDYIRYPSRWKAIESNLRKLDNAEGDFKIWWAATIQAYNLTHLPDMMMWKISQNFKRINSPRFLMDRPVITPHPLHNPRFLNIKMYPSASKRHVEDLFNQHKLDAKDRIYSIDFYDADMMPHDVHDTVYKQFCKILDSYVRYMKAEDYSDQLAKFWTYTTKLDEIRGQSFRDANPLAYDLLKMS